LCEYGVASPDITNTSSSPVGETRFGILVRWHDYGKAVWADKKYIPGAAGVLGVTDHYFAPIEYYYSFIE
jgi:hypothetical protein